MSFDGRRVTVHGNGFVQIMLDDAGDRRMHIWDPRLPRQEVDTSIHNHRFSFESKILLGAMLNVRMEFMPTDINSCKALYLLYYPEADDKKDPASNTELKLTESVMSGWFRITDAQIYHPGETYYMPPGAFHLSQPQGTTVTVMRKIRKEPWSVLVACRKDQSPDNQFDRMKQGLQSWVEEIYQSHLKEALKI